MLNESIILEFKDTCISYSLKASFFKKLNPYVIKNINLQIYQNKILGIVGESGSGKSSLIKSILFLTKVIKGNIFYQGIDILKLNHKEKKDFLKNVQLIFQDSLDALNPKKTLYEILIEPLNIHYATMKLEQKNHKINQLLEIIDLTKNDLVKYPHEFSGGQRQRIAIARAIIVEPNILICDEPLSALDNYMQAKIINLLLDIQAYYNMTIIIISHDLSVIRCLTDYIAILKNGVLVEYGLSMDIFQFPKHAYTKELIDSIF